MGPSGTDILVLAVLQGASTEEVGLVRTTCRLLLSFLGRAVSLSAPIVRHPPVFNTKRSSHVQLTAPSGTRQRGEGNIFDD